MNKSLLKKTLFTLPLLVVVVSLLLIYQSPIKINPSFIKENNWNQVAIDDSSLGGNSNAKSSINEKQQFDFEYNLGDSLKYPFSLLLFEKKDLKPINLKGYDKIEIDINASKGKRIPIIFFTWIKEYSTEKNFETYLRTRSSIFPKKETKKLNLLFEELETPSWWYTNNDLLETDVLKPNWSEVRGIGIGNCSNLQHNVQDKIQIQSITFYKEMTPYYIGCLIFLVFSYLLLYVWIKFSKNNSNVEELLSNQETELNEEEKSVFSFIAENFSDPELTLNSMYKNIGISERKISSIIKLNENLNFKQYLNKVRTSEAKQLLIINENNISEIAFLVGYSNVTHFNRVFKSMESISPSDFRKLY